VSTRSNNILFIFLFLSIFSASNNFRLKKNITSLLNTSDIKSINDKIIVSTSGGIYEILENKYNPLNDKLSVFNISHLNHINDQLWLSGSDNGIIQVLDNNLNFVNSIDYPVFDNIFKIISTNEYAYAIVQDEDAYYIAQYHIDQNHTYYLNTLNNFNLNFTIINDIDLDDTFIYIATDNGLLRANYVNSENNLIFSTSWEIFIDDIDVSSLSIGGGKFAVVDNNASILDINTNILYDFENPVDNDLIFIDSYPIVNIYQYSDKLYILTPSSLIVYDVAPFSYSHYTLKPAIYKQQLSCMHKFNEIFYFGLENGGVLTFEENTWSDIIPNTIFSNQFNSIELKNNTDLIGLVNYKFEDGQSGGFIYEDILSSSGNISNFYSYESYSVNNFPISRSFYNADTLNYWSGNKSVTSVVSDGDDIYFLNNGIYDPNIYFQYYLDQSENYNINLNTQEDIKYGGVIRLNYSGDNNTQIYNVWNMNYGILDGQNGIYADQTYSGHLPYITLNHLKLDNNNNLYVLNPYCEYTSQSLAIRHKNSGLWYHAFDDEGYIPKEITIDKHNNIWIAYQYALTLNSLQDYSPGGIKMLEVKNIQDESDDRWHDDFLDELDGINIWSIDIGYDKYNNEILWILSDVGVQGYIIYTSYSQSGNISVDFQQINNNYYLSDYSFYEGNKIRVDNQNNVWITSNNNGVFVLLNEGNNWLSIEENITFENNFILSNSIYDIKFDDSGYVYLATYAGISILETPYSKDVHPSNISVSPNPFKIYSDNELIITNIPKDSKIKIMNLNGYVVREFYISSNDKILEWDGRSDDGKYLSSGIYLVSVYNSENNSVGVTKLAVIK